MKYIGKFFLIILIVAFFPISLIFVAYYRQRKERKNYSDD